MWYLAVFVPASEAAQAASVAAAVWPDDPNGSQQLTLALVNAQGTAWLGANAAVSDAEIAALQALVTIPDVRWYRYGLDGDRALGLAWPAGQADPGTPWGWGESLAAAGLSTA